MYVQLVGRSGKMGRVLEELIEADPDLSIADEDCDVVIDFSTPEGTLSAIAMGKPLICGTTGLPESTMKLLENLGEKVPVLYSPNFSMGMNFCFEVCKDLGKKLGRLGSVSIEEVHHTEKKDSPSGTALKFAHLLDTDPSEIIAKREGDVVGKHTIKFSLGDEEVEIRYEAFSRKAYATGALHAAKILYGKSPKLYALNELF